MEVISPGWFIWHALIGVAIGYGLRVFEHLIWSVMQDQETGSVLGFAIMIIPVSVVIGMTLGYISLVFLVPIIKDATAISFSAYLLTAFWVFLSLDVRDFLRRR